MKGSLTYWYWGPFTFHRFVHAAQPPHEKPVVFWEIGIGSCQWHVWPWTMTYEQNPWWGTK